VYPTTATHLVDSPGEDTAMTAARTTAALALMALAACSAAPPAAPPGPTPSAGAPSAAPSAAQSAAPSAAAAPSAPARPPATIAPTYTPAIDPAAFTDTIDNPWYPLVPGTRFVFEGPGEDGRERDVVEVTRDTKVVMGVTTRVVHDVGYVDGRLIEDTRDFFAQDRSGTVWYFGEDTRAFDGASVSTAGSFEAGVNGALPGIAMEGAPQVGDRYRQEYAKGVAEDRGEVLDLAGTATVRTGTYRDLVVTKDDTPLEPTGPVEHKYYARGVGLVLTENVTGPPERLELVAVEHF
jgi:hypothetical protein